IGIPERIPNAASNEIAHAVQSLVEETMCCAIRNIRDGFEKARGGHPDALCLSGGVSLNCPVNSKIASETGFAQVHIKLHCYDAGLSMGAAPYLYHHLLDKPRRFADGPTSLYAMLGPRHDTARELEELKSQVNDLTIVCFRNWHAEAAQRLARNEVIAVFEG